MVKPFGDAAFSQKVDDVGPVIETSHGFHIIKVLAHNKAGFFARDEAKARIKREKWRNAVQGIVSELNAKANIKQF